MMSTQGGNEPTLRPEHGDVDTIKYHVKRTIVYAQISIIFTDLVNDGLQFNLYHENLQGFNLHRMCWSILRSL